MYDYTIMTLFIIPLIINTAVYYLFYQTAIYFLKRSINVGQVFLYALLTTILIFLLSLVSLILFDTALIGQIFAIMILTLILWRKSVLDVYWQIIGYIGFLSILIFINEQLIKIYMAPFD